MHICIEFLSIWYLDLMSLESGPVLSDLENQYSLFRVYAFDLMLS